MSDARKNRRKLERAARRKSPAEKKMRKHSRGIMSMKDRARLFVTSQHRSEVPEETKTQGTTPPELFNRSETERVQT